MMKSKTISVLCLAAACSLAVAPRAFATDDFGRIVHHIETQYHVHRQHRFVMGLAGFAVKFYHFAGVKNLKGAIFENQRFLNAGGDTNFDEVMRAALDSGWQPMVQSWDRHSGERTYVYAQDLGKDMKVLVVSLEANEAVVLQVKVDPRKFSEFVEQATAGRDHGTYSKPAGPEPEQKTEIADFAQPNWGGFCLFVDNPTAPGGP